MGSIMLACEHARASDEGNVATYFCLPHYPTFSFRCGNSSITSEHTRSLYYIIDGRLQSISNFILPCMKYIAREYSNFILPPAIYRVPLPQIQDFTNAGSPTGGSAAVACFGIKLIFDYSTLNAPLHNIEYIIRADKYWLHNGYRRTEETIFEIGWLLRSAIDLHLRFPHLPNTRVKQLSSFKCNRYTRLMPLHYKSVFTFSIGNFMHSKGIKLL